MVFVAMITVSFLQNDIVTCLEQFPHIHMQFSCQNVFYNFTIDPIYFTGTASRYKEAQGHWTKC